MNNGGKAEKENTPNEANLQEEEVLRGSQRRGYGPGRRPRASSRVRAGGPAGRGRRPRGAAVRGLGSALAARHSPTLWPRERGGGLFRERVFVGS